ncbi:methylated-DNA--[protein]-cysteine S-methyltransferase [Actinobaculum sp. 313]|uniref:methylated-DNA--[protein]-cysteine S-methyltransferase n=1 Tax=Actinobaculum sp. 313 TaxID=2495645 RepID=UPI001F0CBCE2|nr:methylated-DNA--[protein]-cysteine S-methyltransferase [Actinobaculum sp. 313]
MLDPIRYRAITYTSPIGDLLLASNNGCICKLLPCHQHDATKANMFFTPPTLSPTVRKEDSGPATQLASPGSNPLPSTDETVRTPPVLHDAVAWLDEYFAGRDPGPCPPLRAEGTAFQKEVWTHLTAIPYGQLTTYGQIARRIAADRAASGHPDTRVSARAVGAAVGRNPVSIIVPCHRVVAADGRLTGYSGGVERKAYLLALEGVRITDGVPSAASRAFSSS